MADSTHPWSAPEPDAVRSPCPALNSLANHGYLPRDGKNIGFLHLVGALREVYGLSLPLAGILTAAGFVKCGHGLRLSLADLNVHNAIEHDGSLVHLDIREGDYTVPDHKLIQDLLEQTDGVAATDMDIARTKMKREQGVTYKSKAQRLASRGEPVLAQCVIHNKDGNFPTDWIKTWFGEERLPDFSLDHTVGVIEVVRRVLAIDAKITEMEEKAKSD